MYFLLGISPYIQEKRNSKMHIVIKLIIVNKCTYTNDPLIREREKLKKKMFGNKN